MNTLENIKTQDPRGLILMEVATEAGIMEGIIDISDVFLQLATMGVKVVTPYGTFTPSQEFFSIN